MEQEIKNGTYTIPEGFTAKIEGGKIIVEKKAGSDGEKIRKEIITYLRSCHEPYMKEWIAYLENQKERTPAEWSGEEDEKRLNHILSLIKIDKEQEQKFIAFCGLNDLQERDKDVSWLKSLQKRFNSQPKQEWSEEDEKMLKDVYESLYAYQCDIRAGMMDKNALELLKDVDKEKAWLKSLRPRSHWKPSEEQMEWLESAVRLSTDKPYIHGIIISLYEQLKRL